MKYQAVFQVEVDVEVPDDFCDRVRKLQRDLGESYYGANWSDGDILERVALIRGLRGFDGDEGLDDKLNDAVKAEVIDEELIESRLAESE